MKRALEEMSAEEALAYLRDLVARLRGKQRRERTYLDRRTRRQVYTPTDEALERDQELETELLALLDHLIREGEVLS